MEENIFARERIGRAYIRLSLPLVFSMVVTLVYNLADTFFVAQTNDTNIVAGVSLGAPIFTLLMAVGNIFGQGGSSLMSRLLGRKENDSIRHVSAFCFYATIAIGFVFTFFMLIFRAPILRLIGANDETFAHASAYYVWLAAGSPAIMLSFIHSNLLRSEGMSKESMAGTIGGAVVNIILDPIFISVLGWGAGGAAAATIIGYIFSDLFFAVIVAKKSKTLSMNPREIAISTEYALGIFGVGIPAAIVNLMQSVSVVLVNQFLLPFGNDRIAAMGIVLKINMIALLLLTGFAFGGQPMFGYYYGAEDKKRLRELFYFSLRFIFAISAILTAFVFLAAPLLMTCFIDSDVIVREGTVMLRWQVVTVPLVGIILLSTIVFQSMGKVLGSFILSVSRQGVVFLAVLLIARNVAGYNGIIAAQAISDFITAGIVVVLFFTTLRPELK